MKKLFRKLKYWWQRYILKEDFVELRWKVNLDKFPDPVKSITRIIYKDHGN